METDVVVRRVSDGLQHTLRRLASFARGIAVLAALVGVATFATGWWIFDGSGRSNWIVIGGMLCLLPVAAATAAWMLVRATASRAPRLVDDVRSFLATSSKSAKVLIDHDSGQPIGGYVKSFSGLRDELKQRRKDLPALFVGVRAITSVPGLAAMAVLGTIGIGLLGTILLIGGLID